MLERKKARGETLEFLLSCNGVGFDLVVMVSRERHGFEKALTFSLEELGRRLGITELITNPTIVNNKGRECQPTSHVRQISRFSTLRTKPKT